MMMLQGVVLRAYLGLELTGSVKDITAHSARHLHVCNARTHSAQASLLPQYLDEVT